MLNPLTRNGHYIGHAVSPLNSRTATKVMANSVSKFGGILFTPIWLTAVACYASGPTMPRISFKSQNVPPLTPKPPQTPIYIHLVTARLSLLTNTVLTLLTLTIACSGSHCGLKYQHWPTK